MLVSMTIRNIALIESLEIEFHKGMHVLSGETGAGKSIIVDSINLILGQRADRGLIRSGCERASVEALIDMADCPQALEVLSEQQIEPEGSLLSIQREISTGERNLCRVCGVIVPLAYLRRLTSMLVDINGQHEHQSLLDSKNHLPFLDAFGDADFQRRRQAVNDAYLTWKQSSARFSALRKENARREERQSYLTSRVEELERAQLKRGEADALSQERARFASAEKIDSAVRGAYTLVMGRDPSAVDKLREASEQMRRIDGLDARFKALADRLDSAFYEVEEAGLELRDLLDELSFDPDRNEAIQDRLDMLRKLERRYGQSADELVDELTRMREELSHLSGMEEALKRAEADYKRTLQAYRAQAAKLTEAREALARRFERMMEGELSELGMANTRFACVFEQPSPDQKKVPTRVGDDHVVFYIAPNPGEPLKPLDKTASGGELSRLMLALKALGAEHEGIPCMVFDEIDTGISGNVAGVVAKKMARIARYHQVLCVTHLAQIAAMADNQYLVEKRVMGERTYTRVVPLDEQGRVSEVARLLGVTDAQQVSGLAHAAAILEEARLWKRK